VCGPRAAVQHRLPCHDRAAGARPLPPDAPPVLPPLDYRDAFEWAPVGLVLSRQRQMLDCNRALLSMFGATREELVGRSFEILYPSHDEFRRTGARIEAELDRQGRYADERVMRRVGPAGGARAGELFWCRVSGRALDPVQPHAAGIWAFEDLSAVRAVKQDFTPREREIAALLIEGLTSKQIGRRLGISPRTVDVYRARLMRKTDAATTPELVHKLLSG
jgi:PAS domain S-box-containing protein